MNLEFGTNNYILLLINYGIVCKKLNVNIYVILICEHAKVLLVL